MAQRVEGYVARAASNEYVSEAIYQSCPWLGDIADKKLVQPHRDCTGFVAAGDYFLTRTLNQASYHTAVVLSIGAHVVPRTLVGFDVLAYSG